LNRIDFYSVFLRKSQVLEDISTRARENSGEIHPSGNDYEAARMSLEVPPAAGT
jgi:hypothetical protein